MPCTASAICRPAIQVNLTQDKPKFGVNDNLLAARVTLVGIGCLTLVVAASPSWTIICAAALATFAYSKFEQYRAVQALNQVAVDIFMKNKIVPHKVMSYLAGSSSAVRQLCQQPNLNLNKIDSETGSTLLEMVKEVVMQEIEKHGPLKLGDLLKVFVKKSGTDNAIFLLKQGKIKPDSLTEQQLIDCLDEISDPKLLEAMQEHGFKLDKGEALLQAILKKKWDCIPVYLKAGAKIPDNNTPLKDKKTTFGEYLESHPLVKKRLEQLSKDPAAGNNNFSTHIFAIWKPAIEGERKLRVRDECVVLRTLIIAEAIFVAGMIAFSPVGILSALPAAWLYYKWEWSRASACLNQIALQELKSGLPTERSLKYVALSNDVSLLDRLEGELTKFDENEHDLYHYCCSANLRWLLTRSEKQDPAARLAIFKKAADASFAQKLTVEQKHAYLMEAIQSGQSDFVEYLFATGKVQAKEFSPLQQFECFTRIVDSKSVALLVRNGFNIESQNEKGQSPLQCIAENDLVY